MANRLTHNGLLKKGAALILLLCGMTVYAIAQNNPHKISDKLYSLYVRAYNQRKTKSGLVLADSLRQASAACGDRYGEINALTIPLLHEFYKPKNIKAVDRTAKILMDKAKQYNMLHYYYYAISLKEAYYVREQRYLEAFLLQKEQKDYAKKQGHAEGLWTLYRMDAVNLHFRNELSQAINSYQKTIDSYMKSNNRRYVSREYLSICDCYRMMGDYDNMAKTAEKAMQYSITSSDSSNVYIYMCYSNFMLGRDKEFTDTYKRLRACNTKLDNSYIIMNNAVRACKAMHDNKDDEAKRLIDSIAKDSEDESYRLYTAFYKKKGDYAKCIDYMQRLLLKHFTNSKFIFDSDKESMNRIFLDQHLKAEQQDIVNKNINLELANSQMLLRNSSLELEHSQYATQLAQAASNKNQLSYKNQQLLARQLSDSIAKQKLREQGKERKERLEMFVAYSIMTLAAFIMVMTFLYIYRKRSMMKEIKEGNEKLNEGIKELFIAKDKARQSERMKTMFIQNMSHEIRTPLNAIVGFSQLLTDMDEEIDTEEKKRMTKYIADNSDMLITLVNDILDITDLENNNFVMSMDSVNVNEMCRETIETVRHRLANGVELIFRTDADESCVITTDHNRVAQVIINMLTNAEKNTTKGSITLACSIVENPGMVTFTVTDTGIGVPKEKQKEIFERFKKLDSFKQGTGLGLDICRTIASKLGGSIDIDPEYTGGARFWFIIPFNKR